MTFVRVRRQSPCVPTHHHHHPMITLRHAMGAASSSCVAPRGRPPAARTCRRTALRSPRFPVLVTRRTRQKRCPKARSQRDAKIEHSTFRRLCYAVWSFWRGGTQGRVPHRDGESFSEGDCGCLKSTDEAWGGERGETLPCEHRKGKGGRRCRVSTGTGRRRPSSATPGEIEHVKRKRRPFIRGLGRCWMGLHHPVVAHL